MAQRQPPRFDLWPHSSALCASRRSIHLLHPPLSARHLSPVSGEKVISMKFRTLSLLLLIGLLPLASHQSSVAAAGGADEIVPGEFIVGVKAASDGPAMG